MLTSDEERFHVSGAPWPVRSPDLTVPDFFQWGYLKERVYGSRSHTMRERKRDIWHEIATRVKSCWAELLAVLTVLRFDNMRQCVANEGAVFKLLSAYRK